MEQEQDSLFSAPDEPTKRCADCGEAKPLSDFHRSRSKKDGRQGRCKSCNIEVNKRWYRSHPEVRARRMDPYNRERRHTMQRHVIEYLREHPCVDCGETDPIVLEFDHLRDKIANVSAMALAKRPWRVILAEIEKCEVVCANCHRRRTLARSGAFRWTFGMGAAST